MAIRFIYFDLGNVLLHFDHMIACRNLAKVAGSDAERIHEFLFADGLQFAYERGDITSELFCERFRQRFRTTADDKTLMTAGSDMFRVNATVIPLVAWLHAAGYRLGVLSNTCEAHWLFVSDGRYRLLELFFDQFVLSYVVGAMKPEDKIYQRAIEGAGCRSEEIFFMDDRSENVEGAQRAGLDAVLFTSANRLVRDLVQRDVRFNL